MKINIKNLGIIKEAEIDLSKNLIVFTGYNNTGKTYLNYLLYGLYKLPFYKIKEQFESLLEIEDLSQEKIHLQVNLNSFYNEKFQTLIEIYENLLKESLVDIFLSNNIIPEIKLIKEGIEEDEFNQLINEIDKEENFSTGFDGIDLENNKGTYELSNGIIKIIFNKITNNKSEYNNIKERTIFILKLLSYIHIEKVLRKTVTFNHINNVSNLKVYFFPAERATLNQYAREIVGNVFKANKEDIITPFLKEEVHKNKISKFQLPLEDFIYYVLNIKDTEKKTSNFANLADELETMLGGNVFLDKYGSFMFQPENSNPLDIQLSSSTIKSLSIFVVYLRHEAKENDVIFIDEPELNLHPRNQIIFTRILAKLVNKGVKVFVSTHSDYITRELSNLILLEKDKDNEEKYWEKYGLTEEFFLNKEKVALYYFEPNGQVKQKEINEYGLEVESFNEEIGNQSQRFDTIYFKAND